MASNIKITRICEYCGNSFVAQTTVTRYCSKICNNRNYKKIAREKRIMKSHEETAEKLKPNQSIPPSAEKPFLSIAETCRLLGVSRTTLWRLIKNDRLRVTKLGGRTIISREKIFEMFK